MWEKTPQERAVQFALDRGREALRPLEPLHSPLPTQPLIEYRPPALLEYRPVEVAPVVRQNDHESVFKGSGNSHFSFEAGKGFHVTTEIPGLGQGQRINIQDDLY